MDAFAALKAGAARSKAGPSANGGASAAAGSSKASAGIDAKAQPWVEKYRPKNINSVEGQEHTTRVLKKSLGRADLPHMLFYGPPGTGKTSTILALARELFGPEVMRTRVLELNASDERGISVVREKIKNFAKVAISQPSSDYPCPPYKIIILDEADSMTQDAQSALRRIMETYSKITRFCLVCNYVTRIIEPIVSRCTKFRFKPLSNHNTLNRLKEICSYESVRASDDVLNALIKVADGDLRRAITFLQSASRLHRIEADASTGDGDAAKMDVDVGATDKDGITTSEVQEIGGVVPDDAMERLAVALGASDATGDVEMKGSRKMSEFDRVRTTVEWLARQGFSATQLLSQLHDLLLLNPILPAKPKAKIAMVLGESDKALSDGADEELQIFNVCLKVAQAIAVG